MSSDTMTSRPPAVARVERAALEKGLRIEVVETETSARSAEEAARAVGASVGQIVKSLVFRGKETGRAYLILVSGSNRVDEARMAEHLGEALERPDAAFVKQETGFSIGGVAPLGTSRPLRTFMDEDLFLHADIWAAAGSPRHVFEVVPLQLRSATGAEVGRVK